jgi:hypothetical protein
MRHDLLPVLDAGLANLLRLLTSTPGGSLADPDWEAVLRVGRLSRLLAVARERMAQAGTLDAIPPTVRVHFDAEANLAAYQRQMVRFAMQEIGETLAPLGVPLVALKGGAYVLQDLPVSRGRMLADADIMVRRSDLDRVEEALRGAGWEFAELHPYDEHYYRAWTHELPPLRHTAHKLELDLHHTILPLTSRVQPNSAALFAASTPVPGTPWCVLSREDQIVHACLHLFHDSDCSDRLRDLIDIESLLGELGDDEAAWQRLHQRALVHDSQDAVWYGLHFTQRLLGAVLPAAATSLLVELAPSRIRTRAMDYLIPAALLPSSSEGRTPLSVRARKHALFLRSHLLRMPPWLLLWHGANKGARELTEWWHQRFPVEGAAR